MDPASTVPSATPPDPFPAAGPGGQPGAPTPVTLAYTGEGGELLLIGIVNWLLTMVTLGFYFAWARVRYLRFMIGSVRANGDPFTFLGKGSELFWGVLRAWLLFGLPLIALAVAINLTTGDPGTTALLMALFYAVLLVFVPFAVIGSLRYRASRTSWRGIRFGFDGRFGEFAPQYLVRMVGMVLTLGIAYPFVSNWRREYVLAHSRFGSESFGYDGNASDLFPRYLLCWLFTLPTFGLTMGWFHGYQQAYFWNHTTLAGARFRSRLTGGDWLAMSIVNAFLVAFTLGIAAPWAYVRLHRMFFNGLSLEAIDLAKVHARASEGSGTGEAAAGMLDPDVGLDIG